MPQNHEVPGQTYSIIGPRSVVPGSIVEYHVDPILPNDTYMWASVGGTIIGSATTSAIQIQWWNPDGGHVILNVNNGADIIVIDTSAQVVNQDMAAPQAPPANDSAAPAIRHFINGPTRVAVGSVAVYNVIPDDSYTYYWYVIGGIIQSGQGSSSITVLWSNPTGGHVGVDVMDVSDIIVIDTSAQIV